MKLSRVTEPASCCTHLFSPKLRVHSRKMQFGGEAWGVFSDLQALRGFCSWCSMYWFPRCYCRWGVIFYLFKGPWGEILSKAWGSWNCWFNTIFNLVTILVEKEVRLILFEIRVFVVRWFLQKCRNYPPLMKVHLPGQTIHLIPVFSMWNFLMTLDCVCQISYICVQVDI